MFRRKNEEYFVRKIQELEKKFHSQSQDIGLMEDLGAKILITRNEIEEYFKTLPGSEQKSIEYTSKLDKMLSDLFQTGINLYNDMLFLVYQDHDENRIRQETEAVIEHSNSIRQLEQCAPIRYLRKANKHRPVELALTEIKKTIRERMKQLKIRDG